MRITFIPSHYIVKRQPNSLHRKIFAVLNIYRLVNQIVYSIIFPSKFPDLSKSSISFLEEPSAPERDSCFFISSSISLVNWFHLGRIKCGQIFPLQDLCVRTLSIPQFFLIKRSAISSTACFQQQLPHCHIFLFQCLRNCLPLFRHDKLSH